MKTIIFLLMLFYSTISFAQYEGWNTRVTVLNPETIAITNLQPCQEGITYKIVNADKSYFITDVPLLPNESYTYIMDTCQSLTVYTLKNCFYGQHKELDTIYVNTCLSVLPVAGAYAPNARYQGKSLIGNFKAADESKVTSYQVQISWDGIIWYDAGPAIKPEKKATYEFKIFP